eukprot:1797049-Prymnesium_polylepis.1
MRAGTRLGSERRAHTFDSWLLTGCGCATSACCRRCGRRRLCCWKRRWQRREASLLVGHVVRRAKDSACVKRLLVEREGSIDLEQIE